MNSAFGFVIAYSVWLEGASTVALKTDQFLSQQTRCSQEQSYREQFGHAPFFWFSPSSKHYSNIKGYLLSVAKPSVVLPRSQLGKSPTAG